MLDADLQVYQTKPLPDDVAFLFLDGITQKVRELGVVGKVMLCAFGIRTDGTKELLSFRLVDGEDTTTWRAFLVDLKSRGLQGKALQLITVDGHPALLKALREIYPLRRLQRCIAHKLRRAESHGGHSPVPGLAGEVGRRGGAGLPGGPASHAAHGSLHQCPIG